MLSIYDFPYEKLCYDDELDCWLAVSPYYYYNTDTYKIWKSDQWEACPSSIFDRFNIRDQGRIYGMLDLMEGRLIVFRTFIISEIPIKLCLDIERV